MSSIDNRIVEMEFDNRHFERNVQTSLKTLDDLKKGLNFDDTVKKLSGLDKAAKEFSLQNMADSIDAVKDRFSTLGIVGMTIIQDLTRTIMNLGKKAFDNTIGLINEGGKKRALNIEQAKFQFQGLGMDVEQAMDDALYAVKGTAYGLDEAARAASQLGASGTELGDDMKNVLRGISGVAAMTNSSYDDISRIFIKVAGNGRLMGQELLQLSGRGINAAAILAKEFNTSEENIRKMVSAGQISFEMFSTAMNNAFGEHATKANETYTGSLSNVKAALSRLGASVYTDHLEHMRDIFNALIPVIDDLHDVLKPTIDQFMKFSKVVTENVVKSLGKMDFSPLIPAIEGVKNIIKGLYGALKPIKKAFRDIFPKKTTKELVSLTEGFAKLTERFKLSDRASENLRRTFAGLFAIVDIVKTVFVEVFKALLPITSSSAGGFLALTGQVGDVIVKFRDFIKESEFLQKTFQTLSDIFTKVSEGIKKAIGVITDSISSFGKMDTKGIDKAGEKFKRVARPFTFISNVIKGAWEIIRKIASKLTPLFEAMFKGIGKGLSIAKDKIMEWLDGFTIDGALDLVNKGLFSAILVGIKKFIDKLTGLTKNSGDIIGGIKDIIKGITGSFEALQSKLKADVLMKIATAIAVLTTSILVLSFIDPKKLNIALTAIATMLTELFASMGIFEKVMSGKGFRSMGKVTTAMIKLSIAVLILSFALKKMADLSWGDLTKGLLGLAGVMVTLTLTVKALSKNEGKLIKGAGSLILFAVGINILASAVKKLGTMDTEDMISGLLGLGLLLAALAVFMKRIDLDGMGVLKGTGLVIFAAALHVLAGVVRKFGEMDVDSLKQGLLALGILLAELAMFFKITDLDGMGVFKATGILIFSAALLIMGKAIDNLGSIDSDAMTRGLVGLGILLSELFIFMKLMGDTKKTLTTAVSLTVLGAAILIIGKAVSNLGSMEWSEIGKGLVALAGALTILVIAVNTMTGAIVGAAAMLVVAGALAILTPVLKALGKLALSEIGKALLMLAGVFTVLGAAALVLTPLAPIILLLSASLVVLGLGVAGISAGLLALAAAITSLGIAAQIYGAVFIGIIKQMIGLIPTLLAAIANGVVEVLKIITNSGAEIFGAIKTLLSSFLDAIIEVLPKVLEIVGTAIAGILDIIVDALPKILEIVGMVIMGILDIVIDAIPRILEIVRLIIVGILEILIESIPLLVEAVVEGIKAIIEGVIELVPLIVELGFTIISSIVRGIADNIQEIVEAAIDIVINFINGIANKLGDIIQAGYDLILAFINGIADGIRNNTDDMMAAAENLMNAIIEASGKVLRGSGDFFKGVWKWLLDNTFIGTIKEKTSGVVNAIKDIPSKALVKIKEWWSKFKDWASTLVNNIKTGITTKTKDVIDAVKKIPSKSLAKIRESIGRFKTLGSDLIDGLKEGITNAGKRVAEAAKNVASNAVKGVKNFLGIRSPSRVFMELGRFVDEGLAIGLTEYSNVVDVAAEGVGSGALDIIGDALDSIGDILDDDMDFEPVIRPVIDMDDIDDELDTSFGREFGISAISSINKRAQKIDEEYEQNKRVRGDTTITNEFVVHAVIREEADIRKVSEKLYDLQERANRASGKFA